ncbi:MAG TPA: hypothetical protein VF074_19795 [Pyrinomonadaceae bacterium]
MNKRTGHDMQIGLPESKREQDAIVLGGSLAGLLAARVLCDHFERVTIVERDFFPTSPEPRRGTPQANHVHALMPQGRLILEQLFPELHQQMMADGAPLIDMASDIAWLTPQGWGVNFPSDLEVLAFTRPLLDLHVRRRLVDNPQIRIMQGAEIVRLIDDRNQSIAGVVVRTSAPDGDTVETKLYADFVVDATGRASRAPRWLTQLGYPAPAETTVNAFLGYASRLYKIPEGFNANWKCAFVQAAPPERKRGGILFAVEGNRWLVTLVGGGHDYPPTDEAPFLEFARSLVVPVIYDAIKNATPLSPIKTHRGTENRLRHFDKLDRQPRNFVALGDAVCAFNPVYGQGMTIAAMGAMTLDSCLRKWKAEDEVFARRFQKRLAKVVSAPWMLATSEDYRYRETVGGSASRITRFMHRYMDQVLKVSTFDPIVRHVLLQAFGMLVPPSALFQPKVSLRLIRETLATGMRAKRGAHPISGQRMIYDTAG